MRGIPVGRQFASGSSFDCRLSMIAFAAGSRGIVSPGAKPWARSPTGPPPFQTPDKSGCPSGRRGVGPCGATSRGRLLATSGFALPPAGAVTSAGFSVDDFAGAVVGVCAAAPAVNTTAIASDTFIDRGPVRLDFTLVLLLLAIYCAGASLGEKANTFLPSANVTVLAFAICDPSLACAPSTVTWSPTFRVCLDHPCRTSTLGLASSRFQWVTAPLSSFTSK